MRHDCGRVYHQAGILFSGTKCGLEDIMGRRALNGKPMTAAERKARYRARTQDGRATAEAVDAAIIREFKQAYAQAVADGVDIDVDTMAHMIIVAFPKAERARVRARLGAPIPD